MLDDVGLIIICAIGLAMVGYVLADESRNRFRARPRPRGFEVQPPDKES